MDTTQCKQGGCEKCKSMTPAQKDSCKKANPNCCKEQATCCKDQTGCGKEKAAGCKMGASDKKCPAKK